MDRRVAAVLSAPGGSVVARPGRRGEDGARVMSHALATLKAFFEAGSARHESSPRSAGLAASSASRGSDSGHQEVLAEAGCEEERDPDETAGLSAGPADEGVGAGADASAIRMPMTSARMPTMNTASCIRLICVMKSDITRPR